MAKDPKNFTGEDVKRLLEAEERRLESKDDWKGWLMSVYGLAGVAIFVVCVAGFILVSFR